MAKPRISPGSAPTPSIFIMSCSFGHVGPAAKGLGKQYSGGRDALQG
jgi:hypothetical protein